MASNFAFLEKQYPELAELGKSAERNLYRDTDASSYKMGKMAEQIVNLIIIHEKIYTCGETASERIAYLWKEHYIAFELPETSMLMKPMSLRENSDQKNRKPEIVLLVCKCYIR